MSPVGHYVTLLVVPQLKKLVCNLSSFETLWQSNHCLNFIGVSTKHILSSDEILLNTFEINARLSYGASDIKRLRSKLRVFYFCRGDFDVQPFTGMDVKLMPNILELVSKKETCCEKEEGLLGSGNYFEIYNDSLDGIYRIVRNYHVPELSSFPSTESKIQELERKNSDLESKTRECEAKIAEFEQNTLAYDAKVAKVAALEEKNRCLSAEIESPKSGNSSVPKKRANSSVSQTS